MDNHEKQHILSYTQLGMVLAVLLALTVVTVGVSYIDVGFFNIPIALIIASTKVTFVLLFFMHLKYEGRVINISFLSTVGVLFILIGLTFWDVGYR